MFKSSSERFAEARAVRKAGVAKKLRIGISYLDKALRGIFPDDVFLLSASSGAGKTQAALMIALANLEEGKRVYFFALEASKAEIENRILYPHVMERYYADSKRPPLGKIDFSDWVYGDFAGKLDAYEQDAERFCEQAYKSLQTFYKAGEFTVANLMEEVSLCAHEADLIIVDHAHFFSFGDKSETEGLKEIVGVVRQLAQSKQVPFLLVAHMRKRDKLNGDLVPGQEEIHGSSDIFKMATRVVTLSPGKPTPDGKYETFIRICKDRNDSGVNRFIARQFFDPRKRKYDQEFQLDWAERKRDEGFQLIDQSYYPHWATRKS